MLECVDGATDEIGCTSTGEASSVLFYAMLGTTYYILVHGHGVPKTGIFGLTVREVESGILQAVLRRR